MIMSMMSSQILSFILPQKFVALITTKYCYPMILTTFISYPLQNQRRYGKYRSETSTSSEKEIRRTRCNWGLSRTLWHAERERLLETFQKDAWKWCDRKLWHHSQGHVNANGITNNYGQKSCVESGKWRKWKFTGLSQSKLVKLNVLLTNLIVQTNRKWLPHLTYESVDLRKRICNKML